MQKELILKEFYEEAKMSEVDVKRALISMLEDIAEQKRKLRRKRSSQEKR